MRTYEFTETERNIFAAFLENIKIVTDSTDSQIFTFVIDMQSKQKSEIIELETYFFEKLWICFFKCFLNKFKIDWLNFE